MGLFDFMRDAGDKDDKAASTEAMDELKTGNGIAVKINGAKLDIKNMRVTFNDGVVVLEGNAADAATREKAVLLAGNTPGVKRVDERLTVGGAAGTDFAGNLYTVEKGDTLSEIAKKRYKDASKWQQIFEANKPMLKDADKIYPGQVLRIPA